MQAVTAEYATNDSIIRSANLTENSKRVRVQTKLFNSTENK